MYFVTIRTVHKGSLGKMSLSVTQTYFRVLGLSDMSYRMIRSVGTDVFMMCCTAGSYVPKFFCVFQIDRLVDMEVPCKVSQNDQIQ